MKKSTFLLCLGLFAAFNGCRKQETANLAIERIEAPDPTALDQFIQNKLMDEGEFLWSWATNDQVWTALANADFVLSVGYKPAHEQNVEDRLNQIDIHAQGWKDARQAVLQMILDSERKVQPALQLDALMAFPANTTLPFMEVYVKNPETIALLRKSNLIRYAEPIGYEPFMTKAAERSGSGCDGNDATAGLIAGQDYTNIAPGCKQSWNHSYHNISQAWNNSDGSGVKVLVVDSGASDDQENLDYDFNQGYSSGRTVEKYVTLSGAGETPNDLCGHGTSMIGACAAPRGTDGANAGIAYNCDLVSIRAAEDVYLDGSNEVNGVSSAFTFAGNSPDIRIVSMSMGRLTTSNQIRDAIIYAHQQGKMIFCAAGTSYWWTSWFVGVIFPATMTQAIAVTGVKTSLTARCSNCHSGSKVDFVVVMEKTTNGRTPLSLANSGDVPSTVGGSSVATASTAGIAALVWAKYPNWTRQQVFDRLKTSSNYYPSRNGSFGWGRINAQTATN